MFVGHFGVAMAAKAWAPRTSLGTLFIAAQFIDLLWPTLLLLELERVRIDPALGGVTPLAFVFYPISHSLLAVAGWSALLAAAYVASTRDRRGALVVGLLVLSHWGLDALVHRPDLPLAPWSSAMVGLNLWASRMATLAVEVPLFVIGAMLYLRAKPARRADWRFWLLVALLLAIYFGNVFGAPPPSVAAIAWVGQAQWLLVACAYWVDRERSGRPSAAPA
jgi:membrane-bound metal-dependent hydrolase YbcI (DUF457 family)